MSDKDQCPDKHLSNEDFMKMLDDTHNKIGVLLQEQQTVFRERGICHDEFLTFLVNIIAHSVKHGVVYITNSTDIPAEEALKIFLETIVRVHGGTPVRVACITPSQKDQPRPSH